MLLDKTTLKVCLILESQGRILLMEQTEKNGGRYTLIGGKVNREEFAINALIRESFEEANIELREESLSLVHSLHILKGRKSYLTLYFKANEWQGELMAKEGKKFKEINWFDFHRLPDNMSEVTRTALERYSQGLSFTNVVVKTTIEIKLPEDSLILPIFSAA